MWVTLVSVGQPGDRSGQGDSQADPAVEPAGQMQCPLDPQQIQHLGSSKIERDERILKWQQLKDVAKRQVTLSNYVFAQPAAISDSENNRFGKFQARLCAHPVGDKVTK